MKSSFKSYVCILFFLFPVISWGQGESPEKKSNIITRTSFRPLPLVSYNRSKGYILGAMLTAFTQIEKNDTISPPSRTIIGAGFTGNKSWFGMAGQQLYLKQDKFRVVWALGTGKSNFQYFEIIDESGEGMYIDYNTTIDFFLASAVYKFYKHLYGGLRYTQSNSLTKFEDPSPRPDEQRELRSLGIMLNLDTRDYVYYPSKGIYVGSQLNWNAKWLGSDDEFTSMTVFANHYIRLNSTSVLASRLYVYAGLGEVPFVGQRSIGGKDLRGYTQGTYRSDKKTALQTEWRYNFYKKWGAVAFAGMAYAFETETAAASGLLPAGGVGLRYSIIPKMKMNAGIDFAAGKNDFGVYFRVGEAF